MASVSPRDVGERRGDLIVKKFTIDTEDVGSD